MLKKITLAAVAALSLNAQAADQYMVVFEGEAKNCDSKAIFETVTKTVKFKLNLVKPHGECGVVVSSEEAVDEKQLNKQLASLKGFKFAEKDAVMTTQPVQSAAQPAVKVVEKTKAE